MNNREVPGDVGRHLVARIVSSYVKHNRVAADELQTMIASVHQSLLSLGKAPTPTEPLKPAVSIRRSVHPEYVVCLECGFRGRTLRRHLRGAHGFDPAAYYARWKLPADTQSRRRPIRRGARPWQGSSGSGAAAVDARPRAHRDAARAPASRWRSNATAVVQEGLLAPSRHLPLRLGRRLFSARYRPASWELRLPLTAWPFAVARGAQCRLSIDLYFEALGRLSPSAPTLFRFARACNR